MVAPQFGSISHLHDKVIAEIGKYPPWSDTLGTFKAREKRAFNAAEIKWEPGYPLRSE